MIFSKQKSVQHFTLVEIMVAMAVLVILMGFLFQFVIGAQEIWSANRSVASLYDKSQLAFSILEDDFINSQFQTEQSFPGRKFPFYIERVVTSTEEKCNSISLVVAKKQVGDDNKVTYSYIPVLYKFKDKKLYRVEIPSLDFYKTPLPFVKDPPEKNVLLDGVSNFRILTSNSDPEKKPSLIKIELTLFDPEVVRESNEAGVTKAVDLLLEKHSRSFSKVVFLSDRKSL